MKLETLPGKKIVSFSFELSKLLMAFFLGAFGFVISLFLLFVLLLPLGLISATFYFFSLMVSATIIAVLLFISSIRSTSTITMDQKNNKYIFEKTAFLWFKSKVEISYLNPPILVISPHHPMILFPGTRQYCQCWFEFIENGVVKTVSHTSIMMRPGMLRKSSNMFNPNADYPTDFFEGTNPNDVAIFLGIKYEERKDGVPINNEVPKPN